MIVFSLIYLGTGVLAGLLAGLLGVGGGIIVVPILYGIFAHLYSLDMAMHLAIGTSLAFMMLNAPYAVQQHHKQKNVDWNDFKLFCVPTLCGAAIGAYVATSLEGVILKQAFGGFCLCAAFYILKQMLFSETANSHKPYTPKPVTDSGFCVFVGFLATILGVGGSTLMVPYLLWRGRVMRIAVGTSSSLIPLISGLGALCYIVMGLSHPNLPVGSVGFVYPIALLGLLVGGIPGSNIGVRWAKHFPERALKGLFGFVLCITAYKMFH